MRFGTLFSILLFLTDNTLQKTEFVRTFLDRGVAWPNTQRSNYEQKSVRANGSLFNTQQQTNQSCHTIINRRPPPVNRRINSRDLQSSSSEQEDKVQIVWSRQETNQADPAQHLQSLIREELIPGETALMNIVRGSTYSKKNADTVCIHCGKTFINEKNHKKHTDKCQKGQQIKL